MNKRRGLLIASGLFIGMTNPVHADNEWIQGVWNCELYTSNPTMSCHAYGYTQFSGNQYESETTMDCNTGSTQGAMWGTYSLNGRGSTWSLTFNPQGSVPPMKKLEKSTKTIRLNDERTVIASKTTTRLKDGGEISEEGLCHKVR
jgi:hypothetical protein